MFKLWQNIEDAPGKCACRRGWKEGETTMWLRGIAVNLFTSRAGLSDQSVSSSNSKPFRYLVFFSFSMLDTLEKEKQMFPPIWTPQRFLKQNQLLKEDKRFYLDWHEKKKSSCLRHTYSLPPFNSVYQPSLGTQPLAFPTLPQWRLAMRLSSRQQERREAIFVTSRCWPTTILVCILHVPFPSTV